MDPRGRFRQVPGGCEGAATMLVAWLTNGRQYAGIDIQMVLLEHDRDLGHRRPVVVKEPECSVR
jgi:hypothetical protein